MVARLRVGVLYHFPTPGAWIGTERSPLAHAHHCAYGTTIIYPLGVQYVPSVMFFAASIGCSQVSFLLFEKMYFDRKKRAGPVSNIGEQAERVGAFRARSATMAPETVTSLPP